MPENIEKTRARKQRYNQRQIETKGLDAVKEQKRLYMQAYRNKKKEEAKQAKMKAEEASKPPAQPKKRSFENLRKVVADVMAKRAQASRPAYESQLPDIPELMRTTARTPVPPPPMVSPPPALAVPIVAVKRGRGRPRKVVMTTPAMEVPQAPKRGRGRPRKQPLTNTEQKMENIIINKL